MSEDDFNSKNWVWIPDEDDIFIKGFIVDYLENDECKVNYKKNNKDLTKVLSSKDLDPCNPSKFNKCHDMAELTHLNEPSVIYNLYLRYMDNLIYTYSGLFLVAINPYKSLPIYNSNKIDFSLPHIYSIAKSTHNNLVKNNKDQSILVTGESGAGKTENTKKIIQYLSTISSNHSIDDKILQANPIMESFGNAKTIKNNNSSRFGKFIKIYFKNSGLVGADINYYLLEKSRVIQQQSGERNYHIFYQFLRGYKKLSKFNLSGDISQYKYLTPSDIKSSDFDDDESFNVDDEEEFSNLLDSFKIVGLTEEEIENVFSVLAIILHLGNVDFSSWKSEQANFHKDSPVNDIVELLNIEKSVFETSLLRPKVKAGREFISKSKKPAEVKFLIDSLSKFLYEILFNFIIKKINENLKLDNKSISNENFIGVLDIAGFEIFKINSFEQLCINFTNEKLQQFFNHHSFILEQSEYLKEDIKWDYIDFGKDLQPTIDLIENQKSPDYGILKVLDDECLMPKSDDKQFLDRLFTSFKKNSKFKPNKFKNGFIVNHYAGEVEYNVESWLSKNKDPINDALIHLLTNCNNKFIRSSIKSFNSSDKNHKKSLSTKYKKQLGDLMDELNNTEPHFVRCILPNLHKKPNTFDKSLVLNQLRCNGVLEGIRITRAGYPNKMIFEDFFNRYSILNSKEVFTKNNKTNCEMILKSIDLDPETFKVGITKLFFKNGVLGNLEELRDLAIKQVVTNLQAGIRGKLSRRVFNKKIEQIQSSQIIARNFEKIHQFKKSSEQGHLWYNLFIQLKPLLEDSVKLLNTKEINDNLKEINLKLKDAEKLNKNYEIEHKSLNESLKEAQDKFESNVKLVNEKDDLIKNLRKTEKTSNDRIKELEKSLKNLESENAILQTEKSRILEDLESLESKYQEASAKLTELSDEHKSMIESLDSSKTASKDLDLEKENHSKSIELLKVQQGKLTKLGDLNKTFTEQIMKYKSDHSEISTKHESVLKEHKSLVVKHESLNKQFTELRLKNESKIEELTSQVSKYQNNSTSSKTEVSKLNSTINKLKSENQRHLENSERSSLELLNLQKELKASLDNSRLLESNESKLQSVKEELNEVKSKEREYLKKIKTLTIELQESRKESHETRKELTESLKTNDRSNERIKEYSNKISKLNDDIRQFVVQIKNFESREKEKENEPPMNQKSIMQDYSNLKLKLNEMNTNLRTEKFENKKLIEEVNVLKAKLNKNISPYSSPNKSGRRSIAIGEDPTSEGNRFLIKQIDDLQIKLEHEELNSSRAENYAIELQKKLNKLQNTRGLNSSLDFEKKYKESQFRVSELENKFSNLFEAASPGATPRTTPTKLTKSESFGRTSLISRTLENANQDFVKIYDDIAKTLKSTREELTNSKSEILRLKSLLRESEDELYHIKREDHKTSIENYENDLASSKVKQENLRLRNDDLSKSVELYKKRSDEYYKKLELAESAITISKRHEESALKELADVKNEFKLLKDELRSSEILIKDLNKQKGTLNNEIKDKNYEIIKLNDEIKEINDKLLYNRKVYENREINEKLKTDIQNLNNELKFKLDNESKLIKENKQMTIDNETLTSQKQKLENEYEIKLDRIDELEIQEDKLTKRVRVLENEKMINDRKIVNSTKQIANLKELINDITLQRDNLIETKDALEEENMILKQNLDEKSMELSSLGSDLTILRSHLESQRLESSGIQQELNQSKISSTDDVVNYSRLKKENLVIVQENDALVRINKELKVKLDSLEDKLYNDEQIKYWENKLQEMNYKLDVQQTENFKLNKIIYNYEQDIRTSKIRSENDSKLIKKYNDENFDYQNKMNHYKTNLDVLQTDNFEKDLRIKNFERENVEMREDNLVLKKELLELRARLGV